VALGSMFRPFPHSQGDPMRALHSNCRAIVLEDGEVRAVEHIRDRGQMRLDLGLHLFRKLRPPAHSPTFRRAAAIEPRSPSLLGPLPLADMFGAERGPHLSGRAFEARLGSVSGSVATGAQGRRRARACSEGQSAANFLKER